MSTPTVTIFTSEGPRDVVFDMHRLVAIEKATGATVTSIFFDRFAEKTEGDGTVRVGDGMSLMRRLDLTFITSFLRGCLDVEPATVIPMEKTFPVFLELMVPFGQAVILVTGGSVGPEASGEEGDQVVSPSAAPMP